ncbi:MAG: hypothetical protein N2662_05160 [Bacteroidales bacterium]|nr:hypothetical protein [Bacteroidales bacterium]
MWRIVNIIFIEIVVSALNFLNANSSIRVDARFDSTQILIGDQINLTVTVEQPENAKVILPNFRDSLAGKIEILKFFPNDTQRLDNKRIKVQQRYLVTSFDSGLYQVGPIVFKYFFENKEDSIISDPVILVVNTIPIKDLTKIADIKTVIKLPLTFKEVLPFMGITLLFLILVALGIYAYLRWKQNKPLFPFMEKPAEPAHVVAFRELEKLKNAKLWQQGQFKEYYSRLTDIIRTYIEARFNVPALESTTLEIYQTMSSLEGVPREQVEELHQMLQLADLVKFAKAEPLPDENDHAWHVAYTFVSKTLILPSENINTENQVGEQKL